MKKNILWSLAALMAVALLSVGLSACGDEAEGGTDGDENVNYEVEGAWEGTFVALESEEGTTEATATYTFYDDGTGRCKEVRPWLEEPNATITTFTFTKTSDKKGVITYPDADGSSTLNYQIEGKRIRIYASDPSNPILVLTRKATPYSEKGAAVGLWSDVLYVGNVDCPTFIFSRKEIWHEGFPGCHGMHLEMRSADKTSFGQGFTYKENNGTEGTLTHSGSLIFRQSECYEIEKDRMFVYDAVGGPLLYGLMKMNTAGSALTGTWEGAGTKGMPLEKEWLSVEFGSGGAGTITYEEGHDLSAPRQNVLSMTYEVNEDANICGVIRPSGDNSFFFILWNSQLHLMRVLNETEMLAHTCAILNKK